MEHDDGFSFLISAEVISSEIWSAIHHSYLVCINILTTHRSLSACCPCSPPRPPGPAPGTAWCWTAGRSSSWIEVTWCLGRLSPWSPPQRSPLSEQREMYNLIVRLIVVGSNLINFICWVIHSTVQIQIVQCSDNFRAGNYSTRERIINSRELIRIINNWCQHQQLIRTSG